MASRKRFEEIDAWNLDWFEELQFYVAYNRYKVLKNKNNDVYDYIVVDRSGNRIFTVSSPRDLRFVRHRKRGNRKRRGGK